MRINISQTKPKCKALIFCSLFIVLYSLIITPALAIVDPLSSPNNKFGVHLITVSDDEASPAAQMVNSNGGDWGYITVLVENKNRDHNMWQNFFNVLRRRHLIPIVRLATEPDDGNWKLPYDDEKQAWADFLDSLVWPTKNRYVTIYNEPNQGHEWAGMVNPKSYAQVLDKTITALKKKNSDFFVLNAGFDAQAPNQPPNFEDELTFLKQMDNEMPGIFNKLDGWVSHSYPPGFTGSPDATGRGTVGTYQWELQVLQGLGLNKTLPVFITETGWKHSEGINYDRSLPTSESVGNYFQSAFQGIWSDPRIVAITPFLLNYQESPFDHFSFKKLTGEPQNEKILGVSYPEFYPQYQKVMELSKVAGQPAQENRAKLVKGEVFPSVVASENYQITLTFENTGQSIWNEYTNISLVAIQSGQELGIEPMILPLDAKVEPGQQASFLLKMKAPLTGTYPVTLQLYSGNKPFDSNPFIFKTVVRSPVILAVTAMLGWKKDFSGSYLLDINSDILDKTIPVNLNPEGNSYLLEARYLIPDHSFKFTLHKDFYKPKSINLTVQSDINQLNFGSLQPDVLPALLHPGELWKLLPFSR